MNIIDSSVGETLKEQFSLQHAKKAWSAGIGGAITGAGTVSLAGVFADGKLDGAETGVIISAVVGGFVLGFVTAWLPRNGSTTTTRSSDEPPADVDEPTTGDALVPGDGLGDDGQPKHAANS